MKNYPKVSVGIGGLILRGGSEVLLIKRKFDSSVWTIPGGYMKNKENLFETIVRETKEETGVIINPQGIIGIRQRFSGKEGNNLWIIVIANYRSGKVKPDNIEISQARFMTLREALKEKITPVTKQILRLLTDNKLKIFLPQKSFNKKHYRFFS